MKPKIVFIHGMFQNSASWDQWVEYFEERGFECAAPDWPYHAGEPNELRMHTPERLGHLTLKEVVDRFAAECQMTDVRPIVVGHSVGGLVAQILANRGLASAAVCISSVAPNDLIAADWHLLKNVMAITNPLKGHSIYEMDPDGFHENFCNTMTAAESALAYERTATHDSRQVLRDCLGKVGHIDLKESHVPLLFVAGDSDHIIPAALNKRNCGHYSDLSSVTEYIEFPGRGHFICGSPGWQEIAAYVFNWMSVQVDSIAANA